MNAEDTVYSFALFTVIMVMVVSVIIAVLSIIGQWKTFKKAGKPGWASIVPIYNNFVMLEIAGLPEWYIVLYFIPFANIYVQVVAYLEFAKKFGQSTGFAIGMLFFPYIFWLILGFGGAEYIGSNEKTCPGCGTKLESSANFCIKCGYKFN